MHQIPSFLVPMSFAQLYQLHHKMVYNIAMQYVQNVEDAEEITQDVFVKMSENMSLFRHEAAIETWIYRITINQSLDFIKARKSKKRWAFLTALSLNDADKKIDIPHFEHPGVLLEQKEDLARVFAAINELPDNQKTALILLKITHKTQAETAEIMQISTKAVESLLQRAKAKLQTLL
jgi:RNA polymerase sigma factor (sigma-70 family)